MSKNASKVDKHSLTPRKYKQCLYEAELISYWRSNLVAAAKDLLNIQLLDYQNYALMNMNNAKYVVLSQSRNSGKSFLIALYLLLIAMLYPNTRIIIVGASGKQARGLFLNNIEAIAKNNVTSLDGVLDTFMNELYRKGASEGFSHQPESFKATLLNGSTIITLNSVPDNNRSFRSDVLVVDEAAFVAPEMYDAVLGFALTDSGFKTSTDENFDLNIYPKDRPSQIILASSQNDKSCDFYKQYEESYLEMLAGNKDHFVFEVPITLATDDKLVTMKGKPHPPLLDKAIPETALNVSPQKAMREYYCRADSENESQIVNNSAIHKCSTFYLPELSPKRDVRYIFGYDSAYSFDSSVLSTMAVEEDPNLGLIGRVVNCFTFKDLGNLTNKQLMYPEQLDKIRSHILHYNGNAKEYENIIKLAVDIGSGGNGISQCQNLLYDWEYKGKSHCGMIDLDYYPDKRYDYPNAKPIIAMREPTKWRSIMVQRTVDLINLGVIQFPTEYRMNGYVDILNDDGSSTRKRLSNEEMIALVNIDLMKEELKMIHRYNNPENTRTTYKLRSDMANKMNDDRFYSLILMANELWMLRQNVEAGKHVRVKKHNKAILNLFSKGTVGIN